MTLCVVCDEVRYLDDDRLRTRGEFRNEIRDGLSCEIDTFVRP